VGVESVSPDRGFTLGVKGIQIKNSDQEIFLLTGFRQRGNLTLRLDKKPRCKSNKAITQVVGRKAEGKEAITSALWGVPEIRDPDSSAPGGGREDTQCENNPKLEK